MMEEDDISKIAQELKEAATTDVSDHIEEHHKVAESDLKDLDKVVHTVAGKNIDTNTSAAAVIAGHASTNTTNATHPHSAGNSDLASDKKTEEAHSNDVKTSFAGQNTSSNPYRATTALNAHVSASGLLGNPNIFTPPSNPQSSFNPYNNAPQQIYQPQQFQQGSYNLPYQQQNNNASNYNQPQSGQAFFEMPSDPSNASWNQQQEQYNNPDGLIGWFSNVGNKVFEKTKSGVETMITTLDPGMKSVIYSGGEVDIVVATSSEDIVDAVRLAFQDVFGKATVNGLESRSDVAVQPVGFPSGLKGAENRAENLRRSVSVHERQTLVSVEFFIQEILPEKWYDMACIHLKDPLRNIELSLFSQATPVNSLYVQQAQENTQAQYGLRWSGLSVTVGEVINRAFPYINPLSWHKDLTGVSRREIVFNVAKSLAHMYKMQSGIQ